MIVGLLIYAVFDHIAKQIARRAGSLLHFQCALMIEGIEVVAGTRLLYQTGQVAHVQPFFQMAAFFNGNVGDALRIGRLSDRIRNRSAHVVAARSAGPSANDQS